MCGFGSRIKHLKTHGNMHEGACEEMHSYRYDGQLHCWSRSTAGLDDMYHNQKAEKVCVVVAAGSNI